MVAIALKMKKNCTILITKGLKLKSKKELRKQLRLQLKIDSPSVDLNLV